MLAVKKISVKKMLSYVTVFIILFGITFYLIYDNFFAKNSNTNLTNIGLSSGINNALQRKGSSNKIYSVEELDFLNSGKFKNLKDFSEEIIIKEGRNSNLFKF